MGASKSLKNKVVLVTGASSGIGAALVRAFSQREARVSLAARRLEKLQEVALDCESESLCVKCDVTNAEDLKDLVDQTLKKWGRIDILINNAGIGMYGELEDNSEREIRNLFEVNVFGAIFLTQIVLPIMKRQGEGVITNISSIAGLVSHSDKVTPYVAAKHAVMGFARGLAKDLQGTEIKVNVVCPYLTSTEFFEASVGTLKMSKIIEQFRSRMDTPERVAHGIIDQIFSDRIILFPTEMSEKAYQKFRDL